MASSLLRHVRGEGEERGRLRGGPADDGKVDRFDPRHDPQEGGIILIDMKIKLSKLRRLIREVIEENSTSDEANCEICGDAFHPRLDADGYPIDTICNKCADATGQTNDNTVSDRRRPVVDMYGEYPCDVCKNRFAPRTDIDGTAYETVCPDCRS